MSDEYIRVNFNVRTVPSIERGDINIVKTLEELKVGNGFESRLRKKQQQKERDLLAARKQQGTKVRGRVGKVFLYDGGGYLITDGTHLDGRKWFRVGEWTHLYDQDWLVFAYEPNPGMSQVVLVTLRNEHGTNVGIPVPITAFRQYDNFMHYLHESTDRLMQKFAEATKKASKWFENMKEEMTRVMNSHQRFMEESAIESHDEAVVPDELRAADAEPGVFVVYGDEGILPQYEQVSEMPGMLVDAWTYVEALEGDDLEPWTILSVSEDDIEVVAYRRAKKGSGEVYQEGWVGNEEFIPEERRETRPAAPVFPVRRGPGPSVTIVDEGVRMDSRLFQQVKDYIYDNNHEDYVEDVTEDGWDDGQ